MCVCVCVCVCCVCVCTFFKFSRQDFDTRPILYTAPPLDEYFQGRGVFILWSCNAKPENFLSWFKSCQKEQGRHDSDNPSCCCCCPMKRNSNWSRLVAVHLHVFGRLFLRMTVPPFCKKGKGHQNRAPSLLEPRVFV